MTFEKWWKEYSKNHGGTFHDDYFHAKAAWEARQEEINELKEEIQEWREAYCDADGIDIDEL